MYAWDISHAFITTYHPYCHSPSALTEYLKQKLCIQRAKRLGRSPSTQVEQNIPLKRNIPPQQNMRADHCVASHSLKLGNTSIRSQRASSKTATSHLRFPTNILTIGSRSPHPEHSKPRTPRKSKSQHSHASPKRTHTHSTSTLPQSSLTSNPNSIPLNLSTARSQNPSTKFLSTTSFSSSRCKLIALYPSSTSLPFSKTMQMRRRALPSSFRNQSSLRRLCPQTTHPPSMPMSSKSSETKSSHSKKNWKPFARRTPNPKPHLSHYLSPSTSQNSHHSNSHHISPQQFSLQSQSHQSPSNATPVPLGTLL